MGATRKLFVSRKAMDIDSLGSERLELLYAAGLVRNVADIYQLGREQLIGLGADQQATLQERSADNLINAIAASRDVPFERLVFALGIRYVGEVGAKKLARYFKDMDSLAAASVEELLQVEDVGEVTAQAIHDWFTQPAHKELVSRLRAAGLQMSVVDHKADNLLDGCSCVVSGVFQHFSRDEIKANIESHGGKVSSSISAKTTYLVAGERMGPEKLKKAQKLGVKILTEDEYLQLVKS